MEKEKKVEYVELIYDLIFVYIIGRNNSLIHSVSGGFIPLNTYLTYILCTLIVIQIWSFTTLYINRYGTNGIAEHIAMFVNMYLLYYMAEGTRRDWQDYFYSYNAAWMLILLNLALQYYLKYRHWEKSKTRELENLKNNMYLLLILAGIVLIGIPVYALTGIPLSPLAMAAGVVLTVGSFRFLPVVVPIDFPHLTERVMLYVVFTFGEMVITVAGYFEEGFSFQEVYFSVMAFLIVIGLFISYEYVYDHILDREMTTTGVGFVTIHIFLIVGLNNLTTALEFMHEPEVDLVKKNIFLVGSFLMYYLFLFLMNLYARKERRADRRLYLWLTGFTVLFSVLMILLYQNSWLSIAVTVIFVFAVYGLQIHYRKRRSVL